ncbi:hypothetical protein QZH41_002135 [Actinostola sp. cb2023]|nr:hypothetical protein QZH41_002135 [Actinostola sp. cb2023]
MHLATSSISKGRKDIMNFQNTELTADELANRSGKPNEPQPDTSRSSSKRKREDGELGSCYKEEDHISIGPGLLQHQEELEEGEIKEKANKGKRQIVEDSEGKEKRKPFEEECYKEHTNLISGLLQHQEEEETRRNHSVTAEEQGRTAEEYERKQTGEQQRRWQKQNDDEERTQRRQGRKRKQTESTENQQKRARGQRDDNRRKEYTSFGRKDLQRRNVNNTRNAYERQHERKSKETHERNLDVPKKRFCTSNLQDERIRPAPNQIGYKALENICQKEDKEEAMLDIINIEHRFVALLNSEEDIRVDLFKLVITSLDIICKSKNRPTQAICILRKTTQKLLRYHFNDFITKLPENKFANTAEVEDIVAKIIFIFDAMLHRLEDMVKYAIPISQLQELVKSFHESGRLSDEIVKRVATTNALLQKVRLCPSKNSASPPNDFRRISVVPIDEDFRPGSKPFLRENIIDKAYDDVQHYLDVQFRLLREDSIKTLRDGIIQLRKERSTNTLPESTRDKREVIVYRDVKILNPVCNQNGGVYRVHINLNQGHLKHVKWEKSKRLKYGALVCLSNDFFNTLYFGAVENRDPTQLKYGELEIRFENYDFDTMREFIREKYSFQMIESEAYFESYRHNLSALQQINEENLPFKEHIPFRSCPYKPNVFSYKPKLFSSKPKLYSCKPKLFSYKPKLFSYKPKLFSYKPKLFSYKPKLFSYKPKVSVSYKPKVFSYKPKVFSSKPKLFSYKPKLFSSKPKLFSYKPKVFSSKPKLFFCRSNLCPYKPQ